MQNPHLVHPKQHIYAVQRQQYQNQSPQNLNMSNEQLPHRFHQPNEQLTTHLMHQTNASIGNVCVGGVGQTHSGLNQYAGIQQKSFSSSEEELRYASEMNGEFD